MTWDLDWDIIVNITDDVFISGPICQNYFISSIQNCRSNVSAVKIEVKVTVISNDVPCQVKIDSTFTAITRFVLYNEEFFTIKLITYFLA